MTMQKAELEPVDKLHRFLQNKAATPLSHCQGDSRRGAVQQQPLPTVAASLAGGLPPSASSPLPSHPSLTLDGAHIREGANDATEPALVCGVAVQQSGTASIDGRRACVRGAEVRVVRG